jgi:hypothetical protein
MHVSRLSAVAISGTVIVLAVVGVGFVSAATQRTAATTISSVDSGHASTAVDGSSLDNLMVSGATLRRLRGRLGHRVVHGIVTLERPKGGLVTVQVDRGTVAAVTSGHLAISETGGSIVTVATSADTRVRRDGSRIELSALRNGDDVYVLSLVPDGGGEPTAAIVAAPTRQGRAGSSPQPSASAGPTG